jgi:hypothetical protein
MDRALTVRRALALLCAAFGLATLVAGTRVLGGADPGYVVYRPLLLFNTAMGLVYLGAAALVWRDLHRGRRAALAIFAINLTVLAAIGALRVGGDAVAAASLGAMALRTGFWLGVALVLRRLASRGRATAR